jgi:dihydroorotase
LELLLKNARVVDPASGLDGVRDVLVRGGQVELVAGGITPDEALRGVSAATGLTVVQAEGLWLWPGLVDAHVHLRDPGFTHKETLRSGGLAAAAGGYTSVVCEPNTEPPIATVELVRELAQKARREAPVHVYFKAAMTEGRRGERPADVGALAAERAVVALSDDGDPVVGARLMDEVCRLAARHDVLLAPHCEDSPRSLAAYATGAEPGFEPAEPYANEANYVRRDLELARRAGCRIHFSHVSLAASVELLEPSPCGDAAPTGATWEATPHHMLLCADDYAPGRAPTVNPPLRAASDRAALQDALLGGQLDVVASDHAPHTPQDKAAGACGLIGLETTLGLVLTEFVAGNWITPADAVRLMSLNPARIFGLGAGSVRPGAPADIVLIDPEREWTVASEEFRSRARNTPYEGRRLRGKAVATYVAGREAFCEPDFEDRRERP